MNDGTHFSTPHVTVRIGESSSRHEPIKRPRPAVASLLIGLKAHLGLLALAGSVVTCLIFLFFGDGSWMFALTEASGIGFAPDPAYWTANAGTSTVDALACSALAETVFLPFIALGVCGRFCGAVYTTGARSVSRARGTSPRRLAAGDLLAVSLPVQVLYSATVLMTATTLCLQAGQANLLGTVLASLAPRLLLALVVNESFIACVLTLYRLIPNRAAAFRDHGRRLHRLLRGSALVSRGHTADTRWALDACKQHDCSARAHTAGRRLLGSHGVRRACPLRARAAITDLTSQETALLTREGKEEEVETAHV